MSKKMYTQNEINKMASMSEEEQIRNIGKKMRENADKGGSKGWWIVILLAILVFLYIFGNNMKF